MTSVNIDNFTIEYLTNPNDFRLLAFNFNTNKKYETVKTIDDYKIYSDIGIDIFQVIKWCFDATTISIIDNNLYITINFCYKDIIKLNIICDSIRCDTKEITIAKLEQDILQLQKTIKTFQTVEYIFIQFCSRPIDINICNIHIAPYIVNADIAKYKIQFEFNNITYSNGAPLNQPFYYYNSDTIKYYLGDRNVSTTNKIININEFFVNKTKHELDNTPLDYPHLYFCNPNNLKNLAQLTKLQVLGLYYLDISHDELKHIIKLPLKQLTIIKCLNITNISCLKDLQELEVLDISGCMNISNIDIVLKLSKIKKIICYETGVKSFNLPTHIELIK
jgi:hypothetical protein